MFGAHTRGAIAPWRLPMCRIDRADLGWPGIGYGKPAIDNQRPTRPLWIPAAPSPGQTSAWSAIRTQRRDIDSLIRPDPQPFPRTQCRYCVPALRRFPGRRDVMARGAPPRMTARQRFGGRSNPVDQRAWACGSAIAERGAARSRAKRPKAGIFSAGCSASSPATRPSRLNSMPSTLPTLTPRTP